MATIGQSLPQPESGWKRVEANDKFNFSGTWKEYNSPSFTEAHCVGTSVIGSSVSFRIYSSKFRLISLGDATRDESVEITINNIKYFANLKTDSRVDRMLAYEFTAQEKQALNISIKKIVGDGNVVIDCIDVDEDSIFLPELSKDYEFPVKTIEKVDVEAYAASCINTEEQLLIAIEDGSMYLTKGDGTYIECSSSGGTIIPPIETHTHDNKPVIDSLNDSAGMLSYKGKVVVNNSEYSFKTLPRRKAPTNTKEINSTKGGRLPWQQ